MTVAEGDGSLWDEPPLYSASMGPQLDSCGRGRYRLSWAAYSAVLQWGRNLTVAEGAADTVYSVREACASMGPQLDSCGRALRG